MKTRSDKVIAAVRARGGRCDLKTLTDDLTGPRFPAREVEPAVHIAVIGNGLTLSGDIVAVVDEQADEKATPASPGLTRLERQVSDIRRELSTYLGLPEYHETDNYIHYRWHCQVCRSDEFGDYKPLVLDSTQGPATVECEMCRIRDPRSQVEAVLARRRNVALEDVVAELQDVAGQQAALIGRLNTTIAQLRRTAVPA